MLFTSSGQDDVALERLFRFANGFGGGLGLGLGDLVSGLVLGVGLGLLFSGGNAVGGDCRA